MSEYQSESDSDLRYSSMIDEDDDHSLKSGMDALLQLAEKAVDIPEPIPEETNLLSFSNQLVEISSRLSQISSEKLQVEFENRELQTRVVPLQMEKKALVEENAFLKNQISEFWSEIEKISKEKNEIFRERCEAVRKSVDEVTLIRSELDRVKIELEQTSIEKDRAQKSQFATESEKSSLQQSWLIKENALIEKNEKQGELINILEEKDLVNNGLKMEILELKNVIEKKNFEISHLQSLKSEIEILKKDKEDLLAKLVHSRDNKKASSLVSDILGKTKWTLSELIDELKSAKDDIAVKRKEIDSLQSLVEEMQSKMPLVEANYSRLQQCESELESVIQFNEKLKAGFREKENEIEKIAFEKSRIQTDYQSLRIRAGEFSKQIATLIHENDLIRSKAGIHGGGAARSHPRMSAIGDVDMADESSSKRSRLSTTAAACSFRTVLDLVEQNAELKERVDNLMNGCETEGQKNLIISEQNFAKLEKQNSELLAKRETDRIDSERILTRIEREHRSAQNEIDRLKKLLEGNDFSVGSSNEHVLVLQNQLRAGRDEWKKHVAVLSENNKSLSQVNSSLVGEVEKIRSDLKNQLDQKIYFENMFNKMKHDVEQYYDRNKALNTQLGSLQRETDEANAKLSEFQTRVSLLETEKKGVFGQISSLKATIHSLESSIASLARDKESSTALLMGYHERLEQEAKIYQQNSDMLKKMYLGETTKNSETLSFYQTAYEEQVKRGTELSNQVQRLTNELDSIVLENSKLKKSVENFDFEKKNIPKTSSPDTSKLMEVESDCAQLRQLLTATESLAEEYKMSVIPRLEREIEAKTLEISRLETLQTEIVDVPMPLSEIAPSVDETFLHRQLDDAKEEIVGWERKADDLAARVNSLEEELRTGEGKIRDLTETNRQTQIIASVKESERIDQLNQLQVQLATLSAEHSQVVSQLTLLRSENDKYMAYFAADLSDSDKEEKGKSVIHQLQASLSVHTARETQLLTDLQRVRTTMDTLLHENRELKSIVSERDQLLLNRNQLESNCRQYQVRIEKLDSLENEKHQLAALLESKQKEFFDEHSLRKTIEIDVRGLAEKVALLQSENDSVTVRIAEATKQAQEWKEMHANVAQGSSDTAQLEKAKNQLSQTVSKLREEAAKKTVEIAAITAELKESKLQVAKSSLGDHKEEVKQLMSLVVDYQSALVEAMGHQSPKRTSAAKELDSTPYEDPNEDVSM